jgi:hypothetical protein
MNWQMITALAAAATALGGFLLWALRNIVRAELEPVRQDITVLRVAVFNHLSHDQQPDELVIREGLGYGHR